MKIDILCTDAKHPVVPWLTRWQGELPPHAHDVKLLHTLAGLRGGDVLFLVSCAQIVTAEVRARYRFCLVLHASALPQGRGWSPHIWELLGGAKQLTLSLLSAEEAVDSGAIWAQEVIPIAVHALYDEINQALFDAELRLMHRALELIANGEVPKPQQGTPSYYPKRTPNDSELDPTQPLADLFNALRLADPQRYPAFFHLHGHCYELRIQKCCAKDEI